MKKIIGLASILLVFIILASGISYADFSGSSFDVSIDRVRVNGNAVAESATTLINDADSFSVLVDLTAVQNIEKGHIEATLRGRQTGISVSDSTGTFNLAKGKSATAALRLALVDNLKRETEFDLVVKITDAKENSEQKNYVIRTRQKSFSSSSASNGNLDVSLDRVKLNGNVVAASSSNFIDSSNDYDVLIEFTALEDLANTHVEVSLKDLNSGNVVADSSSNFNLKQDSSSSKLLKLQLLDNLKQSNSFELTVTIADAEKDSFKQVYGIRTDKNSGNLESATSGSLDVSIDSVELENKVIAENENNFVIIGEDKKQIGLKVDLTSLDNIKNAHVDAVLMFENGDAAADATGTFDIAKGGKTSRSLELPLIGKFSQGNFKLKLTVKNADGDSITKIYGLKISQQKIPFVMSSISLSPESNIQAGKALVATLSMKNTGVLPLDGISVKMSVPELGITSTKFLGQVKISSQNDASQDFVLMVPENAQTGTYKLRAEITSQFSNNKETKEIQFSVIGKDDQPAIAGEKLVINVQASRQDMKNDGSEYTYPITFRNDGAQPKSYALLLDGANWAGLRLSEPNAFILQPSESKTINIFASTNTKVAGDKTFFATVKSNGMILSQIAFTGNIVPAESWIWIGSGFKTFAEAVLIIAAVLLVIGGFAVGISRYAQRSKADAEEQVSGDAAEVPDQIGMEAYY